MLFRDDASAAKSVATTEVLPNEEDGDDDEPLSEEEKEALPSRVT